MTARCRRVRRAAPEMVCRARPDGDLWRGSPVEVDGGNCGGQSETGRAKQRSDTLRFVIILILVALAALVGLFVYGQMLEPETRTITQEAENAD